ncbi:MAG: exosortase/archaeosortase family protein [Armatimonadota bacterium]|nr:exosortase/archaeosortase family protein [Armatimonadota bacterium]
MTKEDVTEAPSVYVRDVARSRPALAMCVTTLAAAGIAYWPALAFWWSRWFEKESFYSHGPFVPLASIFIIWFNRKSIGRLLLQPSRLGYPILLFAILLGWFAWMGASASVTGFTLPIFLFGAIVAIAGFEVAKSFSFPLFLLWFAAPPPESVLSVVSFKAQMLSINLATAGLNLVGAEAVSQGSHIALPGLIVDVGGACSGFRLVVSMLAIATFFAYIRKGTLYGKVILVAFALPLSIAVNSVRIMLISIVGRYWGISALKIAHDFTGYALLLVTAALLLLFARLVGCAKYKEMPA